jgi:dTDP-4-dehydrorhamnose reductase
MGSIIVIGGKGQLGQCIKEQTNLLRGEHTFIYLGSSELDITDSSEINKIFELYRPLYCINCAAYTAVDTAEDNESGAFAINLIGVQNLAKASAKFNTTLIHISTDFVFEGNGSIPLTEDDSTNPVNVYGLSKLRGEEQVYLHTNKYYIIRTSWLYSEKANNFCKTMLKLSENRDSLTIIYDQIGTPTYAIDLADVILTIISSKKEAYGLYHYSNEGVASWYDFAKAIFEYAGIDIKIQPVSSNNFITRAKRPRFTVLDKFKIKDTFEIEIPYWRDSLIRCINKL